MINDWYRLNMEVVLTANKLSGVELGAYHDGLIQKIEQRRTLLTHANKESWVRKTVKRLLRTRS